MGITAHLDVEVGMRGSAEISGHDLHGASEEPERRSPHAVELHGHELSHVSPASLAQNGEKIKASLPQLRKCSTLEPVSLRKSVRFGLLVRQYDQDEPRIVLETAPVPYEAIANCGKSLVINDPALFIH